MLATLEFNLAAADCCNLLLAAWKWQRGGDPVGWAFDQPEVFWYPAFGNRRFHPHRQHLWPAAHYLIWFSYTTCEINTSGPPGTPVRLI